MLKALFNGIPRNLAAAMVILGCFALFLIWDQSHWWATKDEYLFGYIVPLFVGYVLFERWKKLKELSSMAGSIPVPPRWASRVAATMAGIGLVAGLGVFLLGAFYRAGAGVSQPGSLAMAVGFAVATLCLVYLSVPATGTGSRDPAGAGLSVSRAILRQPRYQVMLVFCFPAFIWILSAPLVSAIENNLSLFLLNRVTAIVFFAFDMLGLPLERQGNVLLLPKGEVGVAEACSGIRSLTASIFAGSFLAAVYLDRLWRKIALIVAAVALAFVTNIGRSLFLTSWAYVNGPEAIDGAVHDVSGFAILGFTLVGLFLLLPVVGFRLPVDLSEGSAEAERPV